MPCHLLGGFGKDSTESVRQLRILASGYIESLEQPVASLGECVNEVLDENERLLHANGEIALTVHR